ncbi:MAG: hypothetical protein KC549_14220, partial [Myxococcales bacterium]|nr:hypothetical protein [Myxococcales bacterium]
ACQWGVWQGCKGEGVCAPEDRQDESCGDGCGSHQRTCTAECQWDDWSQCSGGGPETCGEGERQTEPCGNCGTRERVCGADCRWGPWQGCSGEGERAANTDEARPCGGGACAAQVRTCNAQCQWSDWGECRGGGQCEPDSVDTQPCGNCGRATRRCEDTCIWGDFGRCEGEGACVAGQREERACGDSDVGICELGTQVRTCDVQCQWTAFDACRGAVAPQREICGDLIDQDCNGVAERRPDQFEPNDSCGDCYMLNDGEPDPNVFLNATLDSINDRNDYYCFQADDGFNAPGFGESIDITLSRIPNGNDYDLYLYQGMANCQADRRLAFSVAAGSANDEIHWGENVGGEDSGLYIIRVYRAIGYSCSGEYRLDVSGLR